MFDQRRSSEKRVSMSRHADIGRLDALVAGVLFTASHVLEKSVLHGRSD